MCLHPSLLCLWILPLIPQHCVSLPSLEPSSSSSSSSRVTLDTFKQMHSACTHRRATMSAPSFVGLLETLRHTNQRSHHVHPVPFLSLRCASFLFTFAVCVVAACSYRAALFFVSVFPALHSLLLLCPSFLVSVGFFAILLPSQSFHTLFPSLLPFSPSFLSMPFPILRCVSFLAHLRSDI